MNCLAVCGPVRGYCWLQNEEICSVRDWGTESIFLPRIPRYCWGHTQETLHDDESLD